jgi:RHS repeat-associated protein
VVWEADYKPFGEASVNPNSAAVNNFRFAGQYYDAETGLHYNWHRYYDPKMGRYLTPDPIGLAGGINRYIYANLNPINSIDPLGLRPLTEGEKNALRYYFGPSANLNAIDLEGTTGRGNTVFPNNINLPWKYFKNNDECEEVDLDNATAFSVLAHEVLHHWQRQHGRSVTLAAAIPQLGYWLRIHDPYNYDRSITDSNLLLSEFISGSVEQQGQMFEDFVFQDQTNRQAREKGYPNRYNISRFEGISQHVYWR